MESLTIDFGPRDIRKKFFLHHHPFLVAVNPIEKYKKLIFYGCMGSNAMCKKNGTRDYWGLISFQDYLRLPTKMRYPDCITL